mgnify:CR=1 FL=1
MSPVTAWRARPVRPKKVALYNAEQAEGNDRGMQYVVSYGGYAPADDPQYALLVFYDEPQIGGASGGTQARPDLRRHHGRGASRTSA